MGKSGYVKGSCTVSFNQVVNWLRVLGTTERSQVDQHIRQQLHPEMPLLNVFIV
jgi:hypothetical protein